MKSVKTSSMILMNRRRAESGELWQARFFDRALRTVKEYNEKVEYIHLNPVKAGLVERSQDWRWSSVNEYSGVSAAEQERRCGLTIDRVDMPSDSNTRIYPSAMTGVARKRRTGDLKEEPRTSKSEVRATSLRRGSRMGDPLAVEAGPAYTNRGARTSVIVLRSLISTCREGPAVSLNGSPTVSPTTAALWASERFPPS